MAATNEKIFAEIKSARCITEQQINLLKRRSNKAQTDLFDYTVMNVFNDEYGIPITKEQGIKGLTWLRKLMRRRNMFSEREMDIIQNAEPTEFTFIGFYDTRDYYYRYIPIYRLRNKYGSLSYIPNVLQLHIVK